MTTPNLPPLRASALPTFMDCPRRGLVNLLPGETADYYGIPRRHPALNIATVIGTALHKFAETGDADKSEFIMREAEENHPLAPDAATPTLNDGIVQLRWMMDCFQRKFPNWRKNAILEVAVETEINGKKITGTPDRIAGGMVFDIKTTARQAGPSFAPQMGAYCQATKSDKGAMIVIVPRKPMKTKTTEIKIYPLDYGDCAAAAGQAADIAETQWNNLWSRGVNATHANPSSALCSRNFCRAHGTDFCPITKETQ